MEKCFVCGAELNFDPTRSLQCQPIPIGDDKFVCPWTEKCFERAEAEGIVTAASPAA